MDKSAHIVWGWPQRTSLVRQAQVTLTKTVIEICRRQHRRAVGGFPNKL
jgi:hypothetical protein